MASLVLCCLLAVAALHSQGVMAQPAASASSVMALEDAYTDMAAALKLIRNNDPELAAYLADPQTTCTFFMPTAEALHNSIKWLGKYAGKAAQNATLTRSTLNYHVLPGKVLTADQVGKKDTKSLTRAGETLFMWRENGKPMVYARPDLPIALKKTNVKAGNCIVHTIDTALVPPTANAMIQGWLEEVGNMPATRPKAQWAPEQEPLVPEVLMFESGTLPASPAPAAAPKSSVGSSRVGVFSWLAATVAVAAVAAVV